MKISESDLKIMVRTATLKEVTNFWGRGGGRGGPRLVSSREMDCPYYTELPAKFKKLFKNIDGASPSAKEDLRAALAKHYPNSSAADPGLLESFANIGLHYARAVGVSCLQFYLLGRVLGVLTLIFNSTGYGDDGSQADAAAKAGVLGVDFLKGIREEAAMLAREGGVSGFSNNFAYYSLPTLAKLGPEADDADALRVDLSRQQSMIDDILYLNESNLYDAFESICKILNITASPSMQKIRDSDYLKELSSSQDGIDRLELMAVAAVTAAVAEAKLNYSRVYANNSEFQQEFDLFFSSNNYQ